MGSGLSILQRRESAISKHSCGVRVTVRRTGWEREGNRSTFSRTSPLLSRRHRPAVTTASPPRLYPHYRHRHLRSCRPPPSLQARQTRATCLLSNLLAPLPLPGSIRPHRYNPLLRPFRDLPSVLDRFLRLRSTRPSFHRSLPLKHLQRKILFDHSRLCNPNLAPPLRALTPTLRPLLRRVRRQHQTTTFPPSRSRLRVYRLCNRHLPRSFQLPPRQLRLYQLSSISRRGRSQSSGTSFLLSSLRILLRMSPSLRHSNHNGRISLLATLLHQRLYSLQCGTREVGTQEEEGMVGETGKTSTHSSRISSPTHAGISLESRDTG